MAKGKTESDPALRGQGRSRTPGRRRRLGQRLAGAWGWQRFARLASGRPSDRPGLRLFSPARHYARNSAVAPAFPINGQALGPVARMKLGLSRFARTGCEVVATYNALAALGERPDLAAIVREYEARGVMLQGLMGVNPAAVGRYFRRRGYRVRTLTDRAAFGQPLAAGQVAVASYWWVGPGRVPAGVHTVAILPRARGGVEVLNRYNDRDRSYVFSSLDAFWQAEGLTPIVLYILQKPESREAI